MSVPVVTDVPTFDVENSSEEPVLTVEMSTVPAGELDAKIENLEEMLSTVGDDAQLANIDMQNMLQKQQRTLQLMSNVSKMLHDTALAVIRKIG